MFPACLLPLSLSFPSPSIRGSDNFASQSHLYGIFISADLDTWSCDSQFNNFFPSNLHWLKIIVACFKTLTQISLKLDVPITANTLVSSI